MNRKMLFFVNPKAGQLELRTHLMEVLTVFTEAGYDVTVHTTLGRCDLTDYLSQEAEHYDLVVCAWAISPAAPSTMWPPPWA